MKFEIELVAFDCRDPRALAAFYGQLLEAPISRDDDGEWIEIDAGPTKVAFQYAPDHEAPQWPNAQHPQQMHLDIRIPSAEALVEAEARVIALGAKVLNGDEDSRHFRVFEDPAGHPFCLVWGD